jgi:hypothetical protein
MNAQKITGVADPTAAQDASTKAYVDSQVQSKDALSELSGNTDDVAEGTSNLYFTNERVDDRLNDVFQDGSGLTATYNDGSNTYTLDVAGLVDSNIDAAAAISQSKLNLAVTTSEIAAATLVTESEGISSNDNDTTIPTSAAVKDAVDTAVAAIPSGVSLGLVIALS